MDVVIGLPLRDPEGLKNLLSQVYNPDSPEYRHYVSPQQFTDMFGPTEEDYQAVIAFVESSGLTVKSTTPNRMLVDVSGSVGDMESAFRVTIRVYHDANANREFHAPDVAPSVPSGIPVLEIIGLDDFAQPRDAAWKITPPVHDESQGPGSGPGDCFIGSDFRAAYAPGVTLDGSGQTVGVISYGPYWPESISTYEQIAGLPNVPVIPVLIDGMSPIPNPGWDDGEQAGDVELVMSMAPGAQILMYEGHVEADIWNRIATDNLARQISVSVGFGGEESATVEQIFSQLAAQGQTIFVASGDGGAATSDQSPSVTSVGGTMLTTTSAGGAWQSETTWPGSGGGVSPDYPIPIWQQGISMATNGGSTTLRNYPDVSIVADNLFAVGRKNDAGCGAGTSGAAPLWAGFMALVNQQAAANGVPPVGFLNPVVVNIGLGSNYNDDFHDITTGNNENANSPNLYLAVPGYDLATGWGTPAGQPLIDDLSKPGSRGTTPSFNLSVDPYSVSLIQGTGATTTVTVNPFNGFTGSVNLTAAGLPSGVSTSFTPVTATTSTLTLSASESAATGTYTGTITGTFGGLTQAVGFTLTVIAPDFSISASPADLNLTLGTDGQSTISIAAVGGFNSTVNLSVSGVPAGVQTSFSPASTTTTSTLSLSVGKQAATGPYSITITGTSGSLSNSATIGIVLGGASTPVPVPVDLSSAYGEVAISNDGTTWNDYYGEYGWAYSANLLGPFQTIAGVPFFFGPPDAWNCVAPFAAHGLTIPLPAGQFGSLQMLADGINGNQLAVNFTVAYSDGTTDTFTQSFSDLPAPQNYPGETVAVAMPYYNWGAGSRFSSPAYLYGYSFILHNKKTVASITMPSDPFVRVLAMTLVPAALTNASDYTLTTSPLSVVIAPGRSGTSTITVVPLGGFNGSVSLATSGLPTGVTASFSPVSTTQGSILTFTASSTAAQGPVTVTVTGTSGSISRAVTLNLTVGTPGFVDMSSAYNANGIYTDGTPFSATGGLDGVGNAYSATLLGPAVAWNGSVFAFGPPNVPDAVTSATIPLPAGQYTELDLLGTGMWGAQGSQTFTVKYTDGTTSSFTQSLSDWVGAGYQNFTGESVAVAMTYRDHCDGTKYSQPVYLYGYSFNLNAAKTVSSITLPNDPHVVVLAMTLAPVLAPTTTTLTADVNPQSQGSNVTFTAQVAPASGGGTPTGTATFYDGFTQLGPGSLDGSGEATYTTSSLTVGTHSITAVYWGDSNYATSTSSVVSEVVNPPATMAPLVSFSAPALSFGIQPISTTSAGQGVTLTNTGTANLTISTVTIGGANASDFSKGGDTCTGATVTPNGVCTVNATFTPSATGSRSASLNFTDNASNSPQTVTLSGTGTVPLASLSAPGLGFGNQIVGATSAAQTETITNTGTANLIISAVAVGGANASDFAKSTDDCRGATVTPNGTCTVSVTFTPSATGSRSASLIFTDNASNSPQTATLSGTGASPTSAWQQMPGALSQVSVGSDGTVWGINSAGQVYMFNPQTQTWQQAPGLFTQVAVGSSGFVWALNAAGQIFRYDPTLQGWDQIPGTLSQIAVGSDGDVWGINSSAQVYHFNSATQTWSQIPGALAQIAVGYDGAIWGINAAQQVYRFNPGTQNWQQIPGALKRVAVGADGDVWGINNAGQTYHFNSLSQGWDNAPGSLAQIAVGSASNVWGIDAAGAIWRFNAQAQAWNQIAGQLAQIGVGANGAVWGVNSAHQIYQFVQPTQPTQTFHQVAGSLAQISAGIDGAAWGIDATQRIWRYDAQHQSLEQIPGALSEICVGFGGNVWGLNAAGQILQLNPSTQTWNQIPGSLAQLAVGADGSVWGIDSAEQIWRFNPSTQAFEQIPGSLAQLAVGADGTVWGINSVGQIWRFNPSTQGWVQIPGGLAQIAVGSANNVWGLNAAGQIWRYDPQLQKWDSIPGALTSIAVAFDGTVWGLNSANQIWRFNAQTQSWDSIPGALAQVSVGADAVVWGLNASGQAYQYW
jgi:hypothetical protein